MEKTICENMIKASDWILIGTSLFLGACALFVPYLSELIKRNKFGPKLEIKYLHQYPYSHMTKRGDGSLVFYCRFMVTNVGKSTAKNCEVLLEELWIADSSGKHIREKNFSPVKLPWVGEYDLSKTPNLIQSQFIDINPERKIFSDIGHISSPSFQQSEKSSYYLEESNNQLKFFFDNQIKFYSQKDCLSPGKAKIKISVYSETAQKCEKYFEISWSGNWKEQENEMFKEIVIS